MTDITIVKPKAFPIPDSIIRAIAALIALLLLGLFSFVEQPSILTQPPKECGPFTIGKSAIGACDFIPPNNDGS